MCGREFPIESKAMWLVDVLKEKYVIPEYQRPYEWNEKNIDDFLSSIFEGYKDKKDDKTVFFGTIQLNKEKTDYLVWDIVDGQQRLTTFLLFLDVIRSLQLGKSIMDINYEDVIDHKELNNALGIKVNELVVTNNSSRYQVNKKILSDKIGNFYEELGEAVDFYSDLEEYVLNNVYFVRLYTKEMELSDVVSVFNTINTTGLDLNASDVFKFRYYDYLRRIDENENWMEKINECYRIIDDSNEECRSNGRENQSIIEMSWILDVYKHIICAQFGWEFSEVSKSNQKFYDDLFKGKKYEKEDDLSVLEFKSFKNIVEEFVKFWRWIENARNENDYEKAMELFSVIMVEKSRYSRYWTIPFVVAFFRASGGEWDKYYYDSLKVNLCMFRFFTIYSVINDKVINAVQNKVCHDCFNWFRDKNITETITNIKNMIWEPIRWDNDNPKDEFENIIKTGLFYNGSRAHLVCTLSALIDEVYDIDLLSSKSTKLSDIQDKLFNWGNYPYDIEHILAQNSFKDGDEEDKGLYNGIGNLVVLERKINREIKDIDVSKKVEEYRKSKYVSVNKKLVSIVEGSLWDREAIWNRCESEIKKIKNFMTI